MQLNPDDFDIYMNPQLVAETEVIILFLLVIGERVWMGVQSLFSRDQSHDKKTSGNKSILS